ncbi:tetratricopeptide repeat protein [candidate division KSB1 bacterium]
MKKSNYKLMNLFLVFVLLSCGGDNITGPSAGSADKLVKEGWDLYEIGQYNGALSKFTSAIKLNPSHADAYNGLGWTHFALHNINQSIAQFKNAYEKSSQNVDILVGYTLLSYESNNYSTNNGSLKWGLQVVGIDSVSFDMDGVDYIFSHNSRVTAREFRKIMALSYFYNGEFDESYEELIKYLNGDSLNVASASFPSELLKELDRVCNK